MKVEVNSKSACKREVSIEVEPEKLKEDYRAVCNKYLKKARIPGFRPGKAPLPVVLQRYKAEIREDFLDASVHKYFLEAIKAEGLSPLETPHIHELDHSDGQPLHFKAEFEVMPQLQITNYKGVEVERVLPDFKEEEVEISLKKMQERMAQFVPVSDRPLQDGDFAVISYTGKFADPGRANLEAKEIYCEVGSSNTLPEFNRNLLGAKPGEVRSFQIKYPGEFPNKDLAGCELEYSVEVQTIKQKQLPDLNDDFARDCGDYATLEELRHKIRSEIISAKESAARRVMEERLLNSIIEARPLDVPDVLVNKQSENRLNDYVRSLIKQGIHPQTLGIDWTQFRERQRERAVQDVKVALLLEHVADKENISVSDDEVDSDISKRAEESHQSFEAVKSRLTKEGAIDKIIDRIRNRKSLDLLLSLATLKDPQEIILRP